MQESENTDRATKVNGNLTAVVKNYKKMKKTFDIQILNFVSEV